jgi:hypothetical protein
MVLALVPLRLLVTINFAEGAPTWGQGWHSQHKSHCKTRTWADEARWLESLRTRGWSGRRSTGILPKESAPREEPCARRTDARRLVRSSQVRVSMAESPALFTNLPRLEQINTTIVYHRSKPRGLHVAGFFFRDRDIFVHNHLGNGKATL